MDELHELVLETSDDLVQRLAHESDPVRAVIELIWNALDAEANEVHVEFSRMPSGGINGLTVRDDGHGISPDEVSNAFGRIGNSWKARARNRLTKNEKRSLHGSKGEGRLRAFALGESVEWTSIAHDVSGKSYETRIHGSIDRRSVFRYHVLPLDNGAKPGTTFVAHNDRQKNIQRLESAHARQAITAAFAPILLDEANVEIVLDGSLIDPHDQIIADSEFHRQFTIEGVSESYTLRIIEWRDSKIYSVHFGSVADRYIYEEDARHIEPQYRFSAYVTWPPLANIVSEIALGELGPEPIASFVADLRTALTEYFDWRRRKDRQAQLEVWKASGSYPYHGPPSSEPERVERAMFDLIASALSGHISPKVPSAKLTLSLLRGVLRHEPGALLEILHQVVSLPEPDRRMFAELIRETSLSNVIRSVSSVADRGRFLVALEHLIYDPDGSAAVNERDHLHRMLENELWVFGEEYNLMRSERGLTEALRSSLRLRGLPTSDVRPVRTAEGKIGRLDLHLAVKKREYDRVHHLVVELKAPHVRISKPELDQVWEYANVIHTHPRFQDKNAIWDFVLVGAKKDENRVRTLIHAGGESTGLFIDPPTDNSSAPKVRAYVRTWSEIISENKSRLKFFSDALDHDPGLAEALAYVRRVHASALPSSLGPAIEGGTSGAS